MPARSSLWTPSFTIAFIAHFLHALAFHSFLHLPGFLLLGGVSQLQIGVIVATMAGAGIAARPAIGRLTDVRGRRLIVRVGSVVHVIAAAGYLGVTATGWAIYGVRVVHGIAAAMLFTVLFTIAADIVPKERRTEGIAIFGVSGMIPLALGGLLGDAILARGDYGNFFTIVTITAGVAAIVSWWLPESAPGRSVHTRRSFFSAIATPALRPLWWVGFVFSFALASYFTFIKAFVLERGLGSVGSFFTAYTIVAVGLRLSLGWLPDRIGVARALLPALLVLGGGLAVLANAQSNAAVVIAGILCGAGHSFAFPIISALVVARAEDHERGSALAMFTALFDFGLLVGGPTFGAVLLFADYRVMFMVAATIAIAGALTWWTWERLR